MWDRKNNETGLRACCHRAGAGTNETDRRQNHFDEKTLILFFAVTMLSTVGKSADDFRGGRVCEFKDGQYDFRLSTVALEKAPKWKHNAESPPLAPRKAQAIALAQAKQLCPEVRRWNTASISLEPSSLIDIDEYWIYMVKLEDCSEPVGGVRSYLEIPIYMDGSTIKPIITKYKDETSNKVLQPTPLPGVVELSYSAPSQATPSHFEKVPPSSGDARQEGGTSEGAQAAGLLCSAARRTLPGIVAQRRERRTKIVAEPATIAREPRALPR